MSRVSISLAIYLLAIFAILQMRPACCFDTNGNLLESRESRVPLAHICAAVGVLSYMFSVSLSSLKIQIRGK